MVAMFLAAADQTILASALPTIASALGGFADLSWVVVSYLLAATVAAPLYGYLGDRFGRRRMLLGALAIFTLASMACALAPTFLALVVARSLQGLGGGGLMTLAQVVSAAVTGRLVTHTGQVNIFPLAGLALATLAFLGLAATVAGAPTAVVTALTMLVGVGLGMVMPPTQVTVQLAAGRDALGVATATISLSRAVGGAIGVAMIGAVLFAQIDRTAAGAGPLLQGAMQGGASAIAIAAMTPGQRGELATSVEAAYRVVFLVIAAITALGAAIAATVPRTEWDDDDSGDGPPLA